MYEKLGLLVGDWVAENSVDQTVEKCEWFEGNKQVICSWSNENDGIIQSGKSIIGY